ncbi:2562_t:CDS:2, partial [Cetraspora pellucida]
NSTSMTPAQKENYKQQYRELKACSQKFVYIFLSKQPSQNIFSIIVFSPNAITSITYYFTKQPSDIDITSLSLQYHSASVSKACIYPFDSSRIQHYNLGRMDCHCIYCGALKWQNLAQLLTMILKDFRATDSYRYNLSTVSEVAAIIVGNNSNNNTSHTKDIIFHSYSGNL